MSPFAMSWYTKAWRAGADAGHAVHRLDPPVCDSGGGRMSAPHVDRRAHDEAVDPDRRRGDDTALASEPRDTPLPAARLTLIVPCYNGGSRLERTLVKLDEWMRRQGNDVELLLVDDGSCDADARQLTEFCRRTRHAAVLRSDANRGKGDAVRRGMRAATGRYRIFTDADLAYPVSQIERIVAALDGGADVAIADRLDSQSRYTMSPRFIPYLFTRHVGSRIFNRIVQSVLLKGIEDTQAGLKGFRADAADAIATRLSIDGFAFDIESLVIAQRHGFEIAQVPVEFRYDDEPTTVRYVRDAWRMCRDVALIRLRAWRGAYD